VSLPVPKVEIGFDLLGANAPFLTLDNPVKGKLDDAGFPLSGTIFFDVTQRVKSVAIRRGKNRQLDTYDAGLANIVFINNDRTFDPVNPNSPFAGQIIPRRAVRISSEGEVIFTGTVDDWNLSYAPNGYSEASAACSDAFSLLKNQTVPAGTATPQLPGVRIDEVLDAPSVNWPTDKRSLETGTTELGANVLDEDTNALEYLRQIARSEPGQVFISKTGNFVFQDRNLSSEPNFITFSDDGTGVGYQDMQVVYGSELLYNEISLTNYLNDTATASDIASIGSYGVLQLQQTDLLIQNGSDLINIALLLATKYSQPEYRFESVSLILDKYDADTQRRLLELELGDIVQVKFTPNGIPPAIEKFAEVIRIDHDISPSAHIMSVGFSTVEKGSWTLSDPAFGRLSAENILSF
jgi:hypothetical protein